MFSGTPYILWYILYSSLTISKPEVTLNDTAAFNLFRYSRSFSRLPSNALVDFSSSSSSVFLFSHISLKRM